MRKCLSLLFTAFAVLISSCTRPDVVPEGFLMDDCVRLEMNGKDLFRYNEDRCQLYFNRNAHGFGAHTDTMSDYFFLRLDGIPSGMDEELIGFLRWTTDRDEPSRDGITLRVVKLQGDKFWLWDYSGRTGIVIRVLE
ncbi:MAG: hypothetical protein KBS67_06635 [Bacteroidales bacterium]|nr:hypothetical protein [Candidatus Cryptobacteroides equifaecalis]